MKITNFITVVLILFGLALFALESCLISAFPIASEKIRSSQKGEIIRQQPPDKCPRGVCENKGRICEVICKNNPSEGGKFCK